MIHIATVHWLSDRWIDLQLKYLERNVDRPYRVYADLEGIEPRHADGFHLATDLSAEQNGSLSHAQKLNALADLIGQRADRADTLVFLDGDAFPVAPLGDFLEDRLSSHPLAAIRRDENLGDVQPHPSFCATTVGFWQELGGDWSRGPDWRWTNALGWTVEDVGGKLLSQLNERGIDWSPLLRTNAATLHPTLFGVYEDRIYHHGAGFRPVFDRTDRHLAGKVPPLPANLPLEPPPSPLGKLAWKIRAKTWYLTKKRGVAKREERITRRNLELSEQVFAMIEQDEAFYLRI
jgi:hypothetical protein